MQSQKSPPTDSSTSAAAAFLQTLKKLGVDTMLANSGTDFPSIVETLASRSGTDAELPKALVVHHESVAMGMAHGHYLASGKILAVMVHVNVGLANAAMGALNARAAQVPVLICSGRTPATEEGRFGSRSLPIHWGQEMFDQASLVREAVKWEYELRYPEQAGPLVARALAIAQADPPGPVYLSMPREVLAGTIDDDITMEKLADASISVPAQGQIEKAVSALANAKNPIIIIQRSGFAGALPDISRLADMAAIPVVEFWASASCLPTTNPMHAGFDPMTVLPGVDVVLTIGAMVPWIPEQTGDDSVTIIHLGPDTLAANQPVRGFAADISLEGNTAHSLAVLTDAIECKAGEMNLDERRERQKLRKEDQARKINAVIQNGADGIMNHAFVSRILSEVAGDDALIFSELGALGQAMHLEKEGQFFWTPLSGGLGWGMPAALGAKLAQPRKTVIATVGDGSYIFANPTACHQVAKAHDLPILTIVFNNGVWNAVKRATTAMYPDGDAVRANEMPLTSLGPSPDYCQIAQAHGAHAERVEAPDDLAVAIERALQITQVEKRQALLEVKVV